VKKLSGKCFFAIDKPGGLCYLRLVAGHWCKTLVRGAEYSGCIAQLVEQLTLNQRAQGSSPCAPTKFFLVQQGHDKDYQAAFGRPFSFVDPLRLKANPEDEDRKGNSAKPTPSPPALLAVRATAQNGMSIVAPGVFFDQLGQPEIAAMTGIRQIVNDLGLDPGRAVAEYVHPVRNEPRFLDIVGHQQCREPGPLPQGHQFAPHAYACQAVQLAQRLIQQKQARAALSHFAIPLRDGELLLSGYAFIFFKI
jgi:hypothetical protein